MKLFCLATFLVVILLLVAAPAFAQDPTAEPTTEPPVVVEQPPVVVDQPVTIPFEAQTPLDRVFIWLMLTIVALPLQGAAVWFAITKARAGVVNYIPDFDAPGFKPLRFPILLVLSLAASYLTCRSLGYDVFQGAPEWLDPSQQARDIFTTITIAAIANFLHNRTGVASAVKTVREFVS